jgi:hypothetical protein
MMWVWGTVTVIVFGPPLRVFIGLMFFVSHSCLRGSGWLDVVAFSFIRCV